MNIISQLYLCPERNIVMNATIITLIVSLAIATLGAIIELSSRARTRRVECLVNKKL